MKLSINQKNGRFTILYSPEDAEKIIKHKWYVSAFMTCQSKINGKTISLEYFILDLSKKQKIYHINGNKLDNQRKNLYVIDETNIKQSNTQNKEISDVNFTHDNSVEHIELDETDSTIMTFLIGNQKCSYSMIDDDLVSSHKWYIRNGYAAGMINGKLTSLHRIIMNFPEDKSVDHINGDKLDNRRENLRIITQFKNSQNRKKSENHTSKFFGVSKSRTEGKYIAAIKVDGETIGLGSHITEELAAEARDMYIVHELPDSLYPLNYPDKKNIYLNKQYIKRKPLAKQIKVVIPKTSYEDTEIADVIRILIPSRPDAVVTINIDDYDKIKYYRWSMNAGGYLTSSGKFLHRLVMDETNSKIMIDHIDNNKLNNTKANLRKSNAAKNNQNVAKRAGTSSKYLGVTKSINTTNKIWSGIVRNNGKPIRLGLFATEELAARARDKYIIENLPDSQYKLNFPL